MAASTVNTVVLGVSPLEEPFKILSEMLQKIFRKRVLFIHTTLVVGN